MAQEKAEKTPGVIYFLTMVATIGAFLFGYDTAIINGAIIPLGDEFKLTDQNKEMVVASTVGGAAVFSLFSGVVADAIGRKVTILVSAVIFSVGGAVMAFSNSLMSLIAGRVIVGAAIGFVSSVVPIYISECAPNSIRGLLITMNQLLITFGIVVSAVVAGALQHIPNGWRYMLGIGAVPGIIQFILLLGLPESPRFMMMKGKQGAAERILKRIRNKDNVTHEMNDMKQSLEEGKGTTGWVIWQRIMSTPHVRKALFIGCMLQMFQQFCGINAVIYYSSNILIQAGFSRKWAIWLVVIPFTINFLATFIGLWAVESLGRKLALAISFLAIGVSLLVLTTGFLLSQLTSPPSNRYEGYQDLETKCYKELVCHTCVQNKNCLFCYEYEQDHATKGSCVNMSATNKNYAAFGRCAKRGMGSTEMKSSSAMLSIGFCPTQYGFLAVIGMIMFVLGFAPGAGPMPWTINAEIYPQWSRSVANSLATVTNWTCNVILSASFLTLLGTITAWGTFLLFCAVCVAAALFVLIFVPETKDKSLEEIELLFMSPAVREQTILARKKKESSEAARDHSSVASATVRHDPLALRTFVSSSEV